MVPYCESWPAECEDVATSLRRAVAALPGSSVEHVGSTSIPGLAAKPIIDIDIIVDSQHVTAAVAALEAVGYRHVGDLGVVGREAFTAPDTAPRRHVYVCLAGTLSVRNHLAVRDVLRRRQDLRDQYAAVKLRLACDPDMDADTYLAGKSQVVQQILAESDLTEDERLAVWKLNDPSVRLPLRAGRDGARDAAR